MAKPDALPYRETMGDAIRWLASRHPDRKLLASREIALTYAQAERQSANLAKGLLARGVGKGTRVGILYPNGAEFVVAFLAAARIGALLSPINTFVKARELVWQLRHSDVQLLLCTPGFLKHDYLARLEEGLPGLNAQQPGALYLPEAPHLRSVLISDDGGERPCPRWAEPIDAAVASGEKLDDAFLEQVESCVTPADTMCVLYTSGSTADPKGVVHTHGAMLRRTASLGRATGIGDGDVVFNPSPFFWTGGLLSGLLPTILGGATILVEDKFDPPETLAFLEHERVTIAVAWPHFGVEMARDPSFPKRDLSSLRGGTLFDLLPESARPEDLGLLTTGMGMTETCAHHSYPHSELLPERLRGALGSPAPGMELKIVDPETGRERPEGEEGELWLRGYALMQGYYGREREDVFEPDGFFRTGDQGVIREGFFFFTGRLGDMIKTGGANVSPLEVQRELAALSGVKASFVVGLPDDERGEVVAVAIVREPGAQLTEEDVRSALRDRLSAFKVPRRVRFIEADEVPMLPTQKLDKRGLVALLADAD